MITISFASWRPRIQYISHVSFILANICWLSLSRKLLYHLFRHVDIKLQNPLLAKPNLNAISVVKSLLIASTKNFLILFQGCFILLELLFHGLLNHSPHITFIIIRYKARCFSPKLIFIKALSVICFINDLPIVSQNYSKLIRVKASA